MNIDEWIHAWFEKAAHDQEAARRALEAEPLSDVACFHSQQCTDKCLKGFLTAHEQVVEKTHDLTDLLEKCAAIEASFRTWEDACERLNDYAVGVRYPGDPRGPDDPSEGEARAALDAAERICAFVRERLDLDD